MSNILKSVCCGSKIYIKEFAGIGGNIVYIHACDCCGNPCEPFLDMPLPEPEVIKACDDALAAVRAGLLLLEDVHQARYPFERAEAMLVAKHHNPELKALESSGIDPSTVLLTQNGKVKGKIVNIKKEEK